MPAHHSADSEPKAEMKVDSASAEKGAEQTEGPHPALDGRPRPAFMATWIGDPTGTRDRPVARPRAGGPLQHRRAYCRSAGYAVPSWNHSLIALGESELNSETGI